MQLILPPEMETFVNSMVERGYFVSPEDVLLNGLYLLKDRAELDEIKRERLKRMLAEGIEQIERGEGIDGDVVFSRLNDRIQHAHG